MPTASRGWTGSATWAPPAADEARVRRATHQLLERLMDVERAELQRMRNSTVIDSQVARRLQRDLDLLRLRDRM